MIDFRPIALSDRAWIAPLLREESLPLCNYSFPVLYCWQEAFGFGVARLGDRLLVRLESNLGPAYLWPVGTGDPAPALEALWQDAKDRGEPLRFIGLTFYHRNWLADWRPEAFAFAELRDGFNYVYKTGRLADLPGKKLHAKRNHIHRLDDARPGWTWAPLTEADVPACLAMDAAWYAAALEREGEDVASLEQDHRAMALALEHRADLGLEGVVLRWPGAASPADEILAYALGAPLTESIFDVHFERARGEVQGAYPAVNRSFAQYVRETYPDIDYINREEDMGMPGLRKAKLSYYPDHLEVNYCAVEAGDPEQLRLQCDGCAAVSDQVAAFIP